MKGNEDFRFDGFSINDRKAPIQTKVRIALKVRTWRTTVCVYMHLCAAASCSSICPNAVVWIELFGCGGGFCSLKPVSKGMI